MFSGLMEASAALTAGGICWASREAETLAKMARKDAARMAAERVRVKFVLLRMWSSLMAFFAGPYSLLVLRMHLVGAGLVMQKELGR